MLMERLNIDLLAKLIKNSTENKKFNFIFYVDHSASWP